MGEIQPLELVERELSFMGEIFAKGIIRVGLRKVGSSLESAATTDLVKALDEHIEWAMTSFVGPDEARRRILTIKRGLREINDGGAS